MTNSKENFLLEENALKRFIRSILNATFLSIIALQPAFAVKNSTMEETERGTKLPLHRVNKKFVSQKTPQAPIGISYRSDGEGKGAFYDHYTVQKSTEHETRILKSHEAESKLHNIAKDKTFNLPYGTKDGKTSKILPSLVETWDEEGGLLFIPGRTRNDKDSDRQTFEQEIIRKAMLKGRPILAVCAGSWRLWEAYGGITKEVKDHNYSGGMLRLNDQGTITYNVQVHNIKTLPNTLLSFLMNLKPDEETVPVNSVHWLAPDDVASAALVKPKDVQALYDLLQVSARAVANKAISLKTRQSEVMVPEEDTVEAFETKWGAPIMGIEWHAEAYCRYLDDKTIYYDPNHINILKYMAKAGDAYAARRRMLKEFVQKIKKID